MEEEGESTIALLAFYRERFDEFDKERKEWLDRVSQTEVAHSELHRVKWELRVRQEEICELQNALSDANIQLFEEREESLKLLAENDQLKMLQVEDRRRIQHLLALTEPVSQEVTFFKDCRPYLMTRKLHGGNKEKGAQVFSESAGPKRVSVNGNEHRLEQSSATTEMSSSKGTAQGSSRVLRTIYLPNEHTDSLTARVRSLEQQLEQQTRISKARIEVLERDRVDREGTFKKERERFRDEIQALEKRLECAEKSARAATKDYLDMRLMAQSQERSVMERMSMLEAENKSLKTKLSSLSEKLGRETEAIRASIYEDSQRQVHNFKRQAIKADDQLNKLKQEMEEEQRNAKQTIEALSKELSSLRKKHSTLQQRRQFDFEGFEKDVTSLREQLRAVEAIVYTNTLHQSGTSQQSFLSSSAMDGKVANQTTTKYQDKRMQARAELLRHEIDQLRENLGNLQLNTPSVVPMSEKDVPDTRKKKTAANKKPHNARKVRRPAWVD